MLAILSLSDVSSDNTSKLMEIKLLIGLKRWSGWRYSIVRVQVWN